MIVGSSGRDTEVSHGKRSREGMSTKKPCTMGWLQEAGREERKEPYRWMRAARGLRERRHRGGDGEVDSQGVEDTGRGQRWREGGQGATGSPEGGW